MVCEHSCFCDSLLSCGECFFRNAIRTDDFWIFTKLVCKTSFERRQIWYESPMKTYQAIEREWLTGYGRFWVIWNGRHFVFQRANASSVNSVFQKVQRASSDLIFLNVYSNAVLSQSFDNKVSMLEIRLSVWTFNNSVIYIRLHEFQTSKYIINESLKSSCGISSTVRSGRKFADCERSDDSPFTNVVYGHGNLIGWS